MQAVRFCIRSRPINVAKYTRRCASFQKFLTYPKPSTCKNLNFKMYRLCSSTSLPTNEPLDLLNFEKACDETLESLTEYFEQIVEEADNLKAGDVSYSDGVLTVNLGPKYGTYVINRQTPNRQIWLSSPISGPKRYDFVDSTWVYKHDGQTLHKLLQREVSAIVESKINFENCSYAKF